MIVVSVVTGLSWFCRRSIPSSKPVCSRPSSPVKSTSSRSATIKICCANCGSSVRFSTLSIFPSAAPFGDAARRLHRLDRHAHGRAAARLGLFYRVRFFRHAIYSLHHRLVLLLGKAGPVNYWLKTVLDQTGPGDQHLFAARHDLHRIIALVAFCISHAWRRRFAPWIPSLEEASCGMRRAALADHAPGIAALDAAGILLGDVVDLHPILRVLRDPRVGRVARATSAC